MDKTHNISLGGFAFLIEDRAYQQLLKYLNDVRKSLGNTSDTEEIIYDVEQRMAELLKTQMKGREVIVSQDVVYLIDVLGTPEQYIDEEASHDYSFEEMDRDTKNQYNTSDLKGAMNKIPNFFRHKKLFRDLENKRLAGVFSGLSHYLDMEAVWLRILFLSVYLLMLVIPKLYYLYPFYAMIWTSVYLLFASIIPIAKTTADKLAMRGKEVNIDTLSSAKESYDSDKIRMRLNKQKGKFLGVFAGMSEYYNWDVTWLRIGYALLVLLSLPFKEALFSLFCVILYVMLWLSMNNPKNNFLKADAEASENSEKAEFKFVPKSNNFSFWGIVRGFFKGIFYFITAIILSILLVLFVGLSLAFFGINIFFLGTMGGTMLVYDYLPFLIETKWELVLLYVSISMLSFVALFVPIKLLINLFSSKKATFPKKWIVTNVILFFVGIIGMSIVAGSTIRSFKAYTFDTQKYSLQNSDNTLVVQNARSQFMLLDDVFSSNYVDHDGSMFMYHNENIEIYVTDKQPYLEVMRTTRGGNIPKAKLNIDKTLYPLEIKNDTILLPNHYKIEKGGLFRGQEIRIKLYLPEKKKITFDRYSKTVVWFNKKFTRVMGNKEYVVTKEGLQEEPTLLN